VSGRRPTYLVIGAMKSGTTSLHGYLSTHPQVFTSRVKEIQYFVGGDVYARGLDWYVAHFADATDEIAVGEASPQYTFAPWFPGIPQRIASVLPDVRLIYLVRDPVARMRSNWIHQVIAGRETRPLAEVMMHDAQTQNSSRYGYQMRLFLEHFPREQLLIMESDRLRTDQRVALAEVATFLGVDPEGFPEQLPRERNRSDSKRMTRPVVARTRQVSRLAAVERAAASRLGSRWELLTTVPARSEWPRIDEALERDLRGLLADDMAVLAELMGDAAPSWTRPA
jgi:hypothetical protein